jgi:hypothetical protein
MSFIAKMPILAGGGQWSRRGPLSVDVFGDHFLQGDSHHWGLVLIWAGDGSAISTEGHVFSEVETVEQ